MSSTFFPERDSGSPSTSVAGSPRADHRRLAQPLDPAQDAALVDALRALHRDLRGLLAVLPVEAQTASGLARRLKIERTTCQRAVSSANQPVANTSLVAQLPGAAGLRALADAVAGCWRTATEIRDAVRTLHAAIDAYASVVRRTAGSRARLLERLNARESRFAAGAVSHEPHARQLFESAAALTGRRSETWLAVHIYEPNAIPERLTQTRAYGLIGHTAREDAVPLTFHVFATPVSDDGAASGAPELGRFEALSAARDSSGVPPQVLRAFSTDPPPIVKTRQPHEFVVQTVEPSMTSPGGCDLVFGLRGLMAHPRLAPPFTEEVWALINFPARWLLLDVFLHRDVARRCIPGLDVHLWRPDFASSAGERWQTRFATGPRLEALGAGLQQVDSPAYARQRELLRHLFSVRKLDPAEYVGYRCQTPYPLWRTGYRMTFDFGEPE
ncbi:MAG: hypothetical protein AB7Q17_14480 [Phycisphaerae bacterium]